MYSLKVDISYSRFIDFNHLKINRLILGALVFWCEHHNFVAWEAESLFFRHFQYQVNETFLVSFKLRWDLVADHSTRCVDLSHNLTLCAARKYVLLRTLFCQVPSDLSSVRKHDK